MAYTQNPGRGNNPKTGNGIPTPFTQVKPNYSVADKYEKGRKSNSYNGKHNSYGVTTAAENILNNYPQGKNLKNIDSKNAVEQIQIAKDSLDYISGAKNNKEKLNLGNDFNRNYSSNNPEVKKRLNKQAEGEYQGVNAIGSVGKGSGSQDVKKQIFDKLMTIGLKSSGERFLGGENFGIPKIGTKENPKTELKKSPAKQLKSKMKTKAKTPAKMKKC